MARTLSLEGLTQLSSDGRALPRLADRWSWENDGLRLRLYLHPQVVFHNGRKLDSETAAQVLEDAVSRPGNRALYPSLNYVTAVRSGGELQVTLDLSEPSAFLPEDLEIPLQLGNEDVGTGAFRIVQNSAAEITLEGFSGYHDGAPSISHVTIRPFPTLRTAWTSLLRGDVDMASDVPPEAVEFISNDEVQVIPFVRRYQYLIAFNSSKKPFSSPLVRRALNAAVDRAALIRDVLQGRGTPATGPVWPNYWAYDKTIGSFNFDPVLASSLLDAAGLRIPTRKERGGRRTRLTFTCLIPANFSILERIALNVQKQLYNIGVDVEFQVVPVQEVDARLRAGRFDALLLDMISGPTPGRAYIFWRSASRFKGLNVFGYDNASAEQLFDVVRTSTNNDGAVRSGTRGLQRVFFEDPPALFLVWNERARALRREFQVPDEPGRDPLLSLWRWKPISTSRTPSSK